MIERKAAAPAHEWDGGTGRTSCVTARTYC
jgi:hypothetical protein